MATDSEEKAIVLSSKKRVRLWKILATVLVAAASVVFVLASRSSNLEWYVTEPIDSHGRRVHVLVPSRYGPDRNVSPADREWLQLSDPNHTLTLTLIPNPSPPNTSLVRDWLKKLRLVPKGEPGRTVTLRVSRNVLELRLPDEHLTADGKVHYRPANIVMTFGNAHRAIPIQGTERQALVIYSAIKPGDERSEEANTICKSLYVE